ncbi:cytochrome c-type biogenesis protein [Yoonia sediminilitoris]|uniref:Cytochrome c-type biogenesis protein n=1 Tax=Yoonia sediminilitoris TaxID=1286148 RepID=A0A2T6KRV1_9RHOB|nr:cytochrome c-type biogenesis protein [Yoonia sediminilitoris]PUB19286.1 cytochrome c-type biogenesis protein CcmH [Yoonia sediminilitoris]RCW99454.1 cytochrome c-type biogenesis protein CcmH [Yoonia sediminilitoris]
MRQLLILLAFLATPLWAVEPSEMLDDPALEERARAVSQGLRCPVCQNESIDESNATLAKELRIVLRERIVAGDSDQEAVDYIVSRYGEFVLLRPDAQGANLILWLAAPALFLMALGVGWTVIRRRKPAEEGLTAEEKAELDEILRS